MAVRLLQPYAPLKTEGRQNHSHLQPQLKEITRTREISVRVPYSFAKAPGFTARLRHLPPRDEFRTLFFRHSNYSKTRDAPKGQQRKRMAMFHRNRSVPKEEKSLVAKPKFHPIFRVRFSEPGNETSFAIKGMEFFDQLSL
jgi:hypothetical protein